MPDQPSPAQPLIGDFAPRLMQLTDDVLFGDVSGEDPQVSGRRCGSPGASPPSRPGPSS